MDHLYDSLQQELVAHLFGVEADGEDLRRIIGSPACAHHLAPCLVDMSRRRGLVQQIYAVLGKDRLDSFGFRISQDYFRINASKGATGLTLDALVKVFGILQAFFEMPANEWPDTYAEVRQKLIVSLNLTKLEPKIVTEASVYVEMSPTGRGRNSAHLTSLPAFLTRLKLEPDDFESLCAAADPTRGTVFAKAWKLLKGLAAGYVGKDGESEGAYKLSLSAAQFLYEVLLRAAATLGVSLEPDTHFFDQAGDVGPRRGQATRALPINRGNFIEPHPLTQRLAA